jgi:chorismate mutase
MSVRAIRGAITVEENDSCQIISSTVELLNEIVKRNQLEAEDIISAFFTTTVDLDAAFPAVGARQIGWTSVALMCGNEMHVSGSLEKCIRVLIHINTNKKNSELKHVYIKGAKVLRPDFQDEQ